MRQDGAMGRVPGGVAYWQPKTSTRYHGNSDSEALGKSPGTLRASILAPLRPTKKM